MSRNKDQSEQLRAESRKKILDASRSLFAERGFQSCNVSQIAKKAGMSQGNIYWYFSSKEKILGAILEEGFRELGSAMAEAAKQPGSGIVKLNAFIDNFLTLARRGDGEEFLTIVMTLIARGGMMRFAELGLSTEEIGSGYHQFLNEIIRRCQAEGTVTAEIEADLLSTFFFSFVNGLVFMYPKEWKSIPAEELRKGIFRLLGGVVD